MAVFLDRSEACEVISDRFGEMTPIQYALAKADDENLDYVFVDHGSSLRIYTTAGKGVGRRGRTETFVEIHLDLVPSDRAGYLWLLFSSGALLKDGTFSEILGSSERYASDLGSRLRKRIYENVVPDLAMAIAQARNLNKPSAQDLQITYEMALLVLFRLLFVAYAEDKDLLPYRTNERYQSRSLKQKARELAKLRQQAMPTFDDSTTHWDEAVRLFRCINTGKPKEWGVPAYDGGLFSEDRAVSPAGHLLAEIEIPNKQFGPVLCNLLVDPTPEGFGPVDFRSLGVREFGTIYEGLLESELSVAEENLVIDEGSYYVPAGKKDPEVFQGQIYLHNRSGARKATGSYFTKSFAVEHLLDHSLEPALDDHRARLDKLDDRRAAESFFDFRVADIAMGSGHFLVAAVDRIERRLSGYLAKRRLPGVLQELSRLRSSALEGIEQAGGSTEGIEIENVQLLRRQIARRCIYGVDINPTAVQLARLSLWIHTFVPGLPLSFLDRTIVQGNSLVGIATFDEVDQLLTRGRTMPLFDHTADALIGSATATVKRLGELSDADAAEIKAARDAFQEQRGVVAPTARMFDILTASRMPDSGIDVTADDFDIENELFVQALHRRANNVLGELTPFHFAIAFPEVFLRERAGFDVILGNPPWEKTQVEEHNFWARYLPGFRGLSQSEREAVKANMRRKRPDLVESFRAEVAQALSTRQALICGPYPGMGSGHPDLFKAFCWRFLHLACSSGGRIGVVLPRSALSGKGAAEFRKEVLANRKVTEIAMLVNHRGWVFTDVHEQYAIGLVAVDTSLSSTPIVQLSGPFASLESYLARRNRQPAAFSGRDVLSWNDEAALPLLTDDASLDVFVHMRKSPRLDWDDSSSWRARPVQGDLNATTDKRLMDLRSESRPAGYWPVYKGESFEIWNPDTGVYYAWADPEKVIPDLVKSRRNSARIRRSAFFGCDAAWIRNSDTLPCYQARIAFRDGTNRLNQRTVMVALVPPRLVLAHQAPFLLVTRGDGTDEAYLLGVLSSIPLDWFARRFVERHLFFYLLNPLPIPRPARDNPLWHRTVALAGRLACPDKRFAKWAKAVGVECGPLEAAQKDDMIHELDAVVAHLYGLSEAQLRHIFETFHEGWDYQPRLTAVLKHFKAWVKRGVEVH